MTLAYTENFNLFADARKYAVYVGVIPFERSSGTSVKGRPRVRIFSLIKRGEIYVENYKRAA